jgi:hypothetical protein
MAVATLYTEDSQEPKVLLGVGFPLEDIDESLLEEPIVAKKAATKKKK